MIVKVFMPYEFYYRKHEFDLFGDVTIEEKSVSYYIITDKNSGNVFRQIGTVRSVTTKSAAEYSMKFLYDDDETHLYLSYICIKPSEKSSTYVFLYNRNEIMKIDCQSEQSEPNDIVILKNFILTDIAKQIPYKLTYVDFLLNCIFNLYSIIVNITSFQWPKHMKRLSLKLEIIEHMSDWKVSINSCTSKRDKIWQILFDVSAGITTMALFLYLDDFGEYFLDFSNNVIFYLRTLLDSLKGSPVGLKLNIQLNNFLLDGFVYHVDLWATFLLVIAPIISYLFIPIRMMGFLGLSFQLALLSDFITVISVHAHCFYIYAAVLYKIEIVGMRAFLKVVFGKRKNILKDRIESYDYMNRQLYLATLLFTILLFLLPTILVYYVVFASLRCFIFIATNALTLLRKLIIVLPVRQIFQWMFGNYLNLGGINLNFMEDVMKPSLPTMSVVRIKVRKCSPWNEDYWRAWSILNSSQKITLAQFLRNIKDGEIMGFVNNMKNHRNL